MAINRTQPWVLFTDLDGTLLDARTYSHATARPALVRLRAAGVPVVFCSSKTSAEQQALRRELGIERIPCIVENGGGVIVPDAAGLPTGHWPVVPDDPENRMCVIGLPRDQILPRLDRVRERMAMPLRGYAGMTDDELAALTGLPFEAAQRARQRQFSETLVDPLDASQRVRLAEECAREGLECRHGGRFHTVTGAGTDKGRAVRVVVELYKKAYGRDVATVGLGDSDNDTPLLRAVDYPYLVADKTGGWATLDLNRLERVDGIGPAGWVQVVDRLLAGDGHGTEMETI